MSDAFREFVAAVFRRDDVPAPGEPEPQPLTAGNVAPKEGTSPEPRPDRDAATRAFVRELFGRPVD